MVITDRFVYLHIPKTGGTFVEAALARLLANDQSLYIDTSNPDLRGHYGHRDQHERYRHIPLEHRHKALLLTVRNPYDHHVSLFEFGWWKKRPGDTFDPNRVVAVYPHFPELSFSEYLVASLDWGLIHPRYAPSCGFSGLVSEEIGPLTFDFFHFMAADPEAIFARLADFIHGRLYLDQLPQATFIPTNRLGRGLYEFLLDCGFAPSAVAFILDLDRVLPGGSTRTEAMKWQQYYSPELKRLVRRRERVLFELFPEFDV